MTRLTRRINETLSEVAEAAAAAEEYCAQAGADESQCLRIGLALDELAANALVHGAVREELPDIQIEVWADEHRCNLKVSAKGPRFDPTSHKQPGDSERHAIGGRGLTMVLAFADQLTYERADGRNITIFSVAKEGEKDAV